MSALRRSEEPKKIAKALQDDSWVQVMQEELLQFKLQQVWVLVDLPHGMKGTPQEGGIDYDEFFAPVARSKLIRSTSKQNKGAVFNISRQVCSLDTQEILNLVNVKAAITPMRPIAFDKGEKSMMQMLLQRLLISMLSRGSHKYLKGKLNLRLWFAEIVDFFEVSNLRYALTAIVQLSAYLSVKQFWQSAIANTKADGSLEINATIDTIRYTISEASIRDSLQLDDATGITMLPNADLFEGMGQIGTH
ncbi:hypothetical protein Tco_1228825 [Tanacetum coccineum]